MEKREIKKSQRFRRARGMRDLFPESQSALQFCIDRMVGVARNYGYQQVELPLIESTGLFARAVGEESDIVQKEMFHLDGREPLTLRPEGTASCVRAGIEGEKFRHQMQRWFYVGPMFRRERPQCGRYRQFHQFGVEGFGLSGPEADAEMILMGQKMLKVLGVADQSQLHIHTLGHPKERQSYLESLKHFLKMACGSKADEKYERIEKNPLRLLDSKEPWVQAISDQAPKLMDFLSDATLRDFDRLLHYLKREGCRLTVSHRLVRGLDYYQGVVFEWITDRLGAQGAVGGGGRYDGLVAALGGEKTPALGMAFGLERLALLLNREALSEPKGLGRMGLIDGTPSGSGDGLAVAQWLRSALPDLPCLTYPSQSLEQQYRQAEREKVDWLCTLKSRGSPLSETVIELKRRGERLSQSLYLHQLIDRLHEKRKGSL